MIAPTLTTERITIAPITLDHFEAHAAAWADPKMTRFIGGKPRSRNESWGKFVQGAGLWPIIGYGFWSFLDSATGTYLGNGGLAQFERGIPELEGFAEAGWAFAPSAWGKGYATEAMAAIFEWADEMKLGEIRCIIDPGNVESHNVALKLGFEKFAESHDVMGELDIYRRPTSCRVADKLCITALAGLPARSAAAKRR